jgi:hypothetical protein
MEGNIGSIILLQNTKVTATSSIDKGIASALAGVSIIIGAIIASWWTWN